MSYSKINKKIIKEKSNVSLYQFRKNRQTNTKVYESSKPVFNGRMALKVIAKAGTDKMAATDYQESIYFVLIPRF